MIFALQFGVWEPAPCFMDIQIDMPSRPRNVAASEQEAKNLSMELIKGVDKAWPSEGVPAPAAGDPQPQFPRRRSWSGPVKGNDVLRSPSSRQLRNRALGRHVL